MRQRYCEPLVVDGVVNRYVRVSAVLCLAADNEELRTDNGDCLMKNPCVVPDSQLGRHWRQAPPDAAGNQGQEAAVVECVVWGDNEGLLRDFLGAPRLEEALTAHHRPEAGRAVRDGVVGVARQDRAARQENVLRQDLKSPEMRGLGPTRHSFHKCAWRLLKDWLLDAPGFITVHCCFKRMLQDARILAVVTASA